VVFFYISLKKGQHKQNAPFTSSSILIFK